jgi:hypothetical protein
LILIVANFLNDERIAVSVGACAHLFLDTKRTFCIQSPHIKPEQGKIPHDRRARAGTRGIQNTKCYSLQRNAADGLLPKPAMKGE